MFIYLIHFEFIFVWGVREYSNFILLQVAVQFSQHQLLKMSLLSIPASSVVDSVKFSLVTQLCPILSDPMNCSMPGLPVHYQLPESTQTQVH